jgi:arginine deiminase
MPDSAHGGNGWVARQPDTGDVAKPVWRVSGVGVEWEPLRSVLLYRPGAEIENVDDPASVLWSSNVTPAAVREQHDAVAEEYRREGIEVLNVTVDRDSAPPPNLCFVRDLFTMTPLGAILSRPASEVRAGEEVYVAQTLVNERIPIFASVLGSETFEGSDVVLATADLALVGTGLRTSRRSAEQLVQALRSMGYCESQIVETPYGCGHLDGILSIVSRNLALLYPNRLSYGAYLALRRHGFAVEELPDRHEASAGMAINIVPLGPNRAMIPSGNPRTVALLGKYGIDCVSVNVSEIMKMGGALHCLTGVIHRG